MQKGPPGLARGKRPKPSFPRSQARSVRRRAPGRRKWLRACRREGLGLLLRFRAILRVYIFTAPPTSPLASLVLTAVQQVCRLPRPAEIRSRSPLALAQADLIPPLFSVLRFVGEISEESEPRGK